MPPLLLRCVARPATVAGCVFLLAALVCAAEDEPASVRIESRVVRLPGPPATQRTDLSVWQRVEGAVRVGEIVFPAAVEKGVLQLARRPAQRPKPVEESPFGRATEVVLQSGTGKTAVEIVLGFRAVRAAGGEKRWEYCRLDARRFDVGDAGVVLVDTDVDGRFDTLHKDGYAAPESTLVVPLQASLVLGRHRVNIVELSPCGTWLDARVERLAGNDQQLLALVEVNERRLREGLPPVRLDPELSERCTAHAQYLAGNGWNTYTNPHFEDPKLAGYTEEGDATAKRSLIMGMVSQLRAVDAFWRTVYHRVDLLHPGLKLIGVNEAPRSVSVIDASGSAGDPDEHASGYRDPLLSPADGAVGVERSFCRRGEAPSPVPSPHRRGMPLIVSFTDGLDTITNFRGTLVALTDDGEVPVEVLIAETRYGINIGALVPAARLHAQTRYRVTYTYDNDDKPAPVTLTATFTTGD